MTNNHFESGAYSNVAELSSLDRWLLPNATTWREDWDIGDQTDSHDIERFISMLQGYNSSTSDYENLTPSQCINLYTTDFVSNHRNYFLITKNTSDATHNNTLLDVWAVLSSSTTSPSQWMCPYSEEDLSRCDTSELASKVASGLPWIVTLAGRQEAEVIGCKSEITKEKLFTREKCKVQFSLGIMMVVIACNLVKACAMITTVVRSREPTLVTLGDSINSFLRIPDPTTMGICFADRQLIEKEWRHRWKTGPRQWKQKKVQRWWTSVSKTRWITCNFFIAISITVYTILLRSGIRNDSILVQTDIKSM